MPIEISKNYDILPTTGFLGQTLKSPFWFALMITVCIVLITIFICPIKKTPSIGRIIKFMLYIFSLIIISLVLHDNVLHETWKNNNEDKIARDMIGNMSDFINNGPRSKILTTDAQNVSQAQPRIATGTAAPLLSI